LSTLLPDDDFASLRDEQVSPAALIAEIRQRLEQRYPDGDTGEVSFPAYELADAPPEFPADIAYSFSLYYHLQRAHELYSNADTAPILAPSPATRLPILGRIWAQARREAHNLILFYVNRHLAHETAVNRHLIAAIGEMTRQLEAQQRRIAQLEAQVSELKQESQAE
jgi:hypothetical protein